MDCIELYSYWCFSVVYCVCIGLNLKGLLYQIMLVYLVCDGGQQYIVVYVVFNLQELVLILWYGECVLQQLMVILEYFDEVFLDLVLLFDDVEGWVCVWVLVQLVVCDIYLFNNLWVMQFFSDIWSVLQFECDDWI